MFKSVTKYFKISDAVAQLQESKSIKTKKVKNQLKSQQFSTKKRFPKRLKKRGIQKCNFSPKKQIGGMGYRSQSFHSSLKSFLPMPTSGIYCGLTAYSYLAVCLAGHPASRPAGCPVVAGHSGQLPHCFDSTL